MLNTAEPLDKESCDESQDRRRVGTFKFRTFRLRTVFVLSSAALPSLTTYEFIFHRPLHLAVHREVDRPPSQHHEVPLKSKHVQLQSIASKIVVPLKDMT